MRTRYECALNGDTLGAIAPEVMITDISEADPRVDIQTQTRPHRAGMRLVGMLRQKLSVVISFVIWERDVDRRKEICQRIQYWARQGGYLSINDRDRQRLHVVCEALPTLASALGWTNIQKITFSAYDFPFWEDELTEKKEIQGAGTFFVPGTAAEAFVSVKVTNKGGLASGVKVAVADTFMTFSGISLPQNGVLDIGYDENRTLYAKIGNVSVLANRTPESDDDLIAKCGERNAVSVDGGNLSALFSARGVYL